MVRPPARDAPERPLLLLDVDGVLSLFGFPPHTPPAGTWLSVDGLPHLLSATAGEHLRRLERSFEVVWCTGWEERAGEHLPHALGLTTCYAHVVFDQRPGERGAHWKLSGIDDHAGQRPLAWVDDAHDESCRAWAAARPAPTLLVATEADVGLTPAHVEELERWAAALPHDDEDPLRGAGLRPQQS